MGDVSLWVRQANVWQFMKVCDEFVLKAPPTMQQNNDTEINTFHTTRQWIRTTATQKLSGNYIL